MTDLKACVERIDALLATPAESVLARHGIEVKHKKASAGQWLNMSHCPICRPEDSKKHRFTCGVYEEFSRTGAGARPIYKRACKCFRTGSSSISYFDLLEALGELSASERAAWQNADRKALFGVKERPAKAVKQVGVPEATEAPPEPAHEDDDLALANTESLGKAARALRRNAAAMAYLIDTRGYTAATIDRFKLGLALPYIRKPEGVIVHENAWIAPLLHRDGRFYKKFAYYVIPNLTRGEYVDEGKRSWSAGRARAYWSGKHTDQRQIFICDGLKDLWALAQLMAGSDIEKRLILATSTNGGGGLPQEWKEPEFWATWERVYLGHDNDELNPKTGKRAGDQHALAIVRQGNREMLRLRPPGVKDWNDWVLAGGTLNQFEALLDQADPMVPLLDPALRQTDDLTSPGRFSATKVDIVGNFQNGFLYEAVQTLVRRVDDETGEMLEFYDTEVIRSDGKRLRARVMPAPKGTPEDQLVIRLSDGTLLSKKPRANPYLTWRWPSIQKWMAAVEAAQKDGNRYTGPRLGPLLNEIVGHLKATVWLPYADDYSMLACTLVVSYCQSIFDAVPLLLVTGAAGTGKSELGLALKDLGANSKGVLGQVSAATISRYIDLTRGLVVLDDLEQISNNKDAQFDDLVQALKVSYKKETGKRLVTVNGKNGTTWQQELNFYGVKVINNTRGADSILGSRMLVIQTRQMPSGVKIDSSSRLDKTRLDEIRDDLHVWAFCNVEAIATQYLLTFPNKTTRNEEIAAPLRVIAALSGDDQLMESLDRALNRQGRMKINEDSPEVLMREALEGIIRRSIEQTGQVQTWVTVTQLMMEMSKLVDVNYGKDFTTSLASIEKPEFVGRTFKQLYSDSDAEQRRTTLFGKTLRAYKLESGFLTATMERLRQESPDLFTAEPSVTDNFKAFCQGCASCPYMNRCELQAERQLRDEKARPSR